MKLFSLLIAPSSRCAANWEGVVNLARDIFQ
jgi:hypothetical protein